MRALSLCVCTFSKDPCEQPVTGAAQRRKQRRLRSWWRHEQQSDRCGPGNGDAPLVRQGAHRERRSTTFLDVFSSCWFNTGYMFTSVYGGRALLPCRDGRGFSMVHTVCRTMRFPQFFFDKVFNVLVCRSCRFPCRGAQACPMVQTVWTIVIPQLQFLDKVTEAPVVAGRAGRRHPGLGAEAGSHGFPCSEDHRDSLAQYFSWWSMHLLCRFAGSL